jgi:biofilm protein TabA
MVFGQYNQADTYQSFLGHPVWRKALSWIQENGKTLPEGEHEIEGRNLYANIQALPTIPLSEGVFEEHQQYIDLHYCIEGGEMIAYAPTEILAEQTAYEPSKDYQLFTPKRYTSTCLLQPDSFAIFFPGEKHMPKLQDGIQKNVRKVVIKIKKDLLI